MRTALPPSDIVLHTSDTIVPEGFSLRCVACAACASTPPHLDRGMSDIFVNIINLISRCNIRRWVEIRQTAKPTKTRNLVDFIPIEIMFESICLVNTHGEAHRVSVVCCRGSCIDSIFRSMFNLHIYFIYFDFFLLLSLTTLLLDVRRVFLYISSSFVCLVFRCHAMIL